MRVANSSASAEADCGLFLRFAENLLVYLLGKQVHLGHDIVEGLRLSIEGDRLGFARYRQHFCVYTYRLARCWSMLP